MKLFAVILLFFGMQSFAQISGIVKVSEGFADSRNCFVKNIGQYGDSMSGSMGPVLYGFENFGMPVLFTARGVVYLQRKIQKITERQERAMEKKGLPENQVEREVRRTDKQVTMEWLNANPQPQIIAEEPLEAYYTYGFLQGKATAYKKITYKDLYPGIDIVYHFANSAKRGFEYSIVVQPGADLSRLKMKWGGDIKKIMVDSRGNLVISSAINSIMETAPLGFYPAAPDLQLPAAEQQEQPVSFLLQKNTVGFNVPGYDRTKLLLIDPFVTATTMFTGLNAGIAKDIDFDYDGNIYVAGGGDAFVSGQVAKFDAAGNLLWVFNGVLPVPAWNFGAVYGGWVVEKSTGKIFIGQGVRQTGTQVIRLGTNGIYDNYISLADNNFWENWKMFWSCNSGNPQILIAGGGITSNINLAILSPPGTTLSSINLTGIPTFGQDIADIVIDPLTNDMYCVYASQILTPEVNNRLYKNPPPYSAGNIAWETQSGYFVLLEGRNRPYLVPGLNLADDNSINALAVNRSYLFYWDGLNLKAFKKADGTTAGTPLTLAPNTALMQGGIIADECNNIFIGNNNGTIKVYKFDGRDFNDAAAPDITIPGFPLAAVYDLAYDPARLLLYACGNGFVSSFDISSYCAATVFNLSILPDCPTLSVQASLSPLPPVGTVINYALFIGATQIAANLTGLFTGLAMGTTYTLKAFLDQACGGIQLINNFTLDICLPTISATFINPSCNLPNGSIHALAVNGVPPYQFSKDGINWQTNGIFTGLAAGIYTISVKDALNSIVSINVTLSNSAALQVTATGLPSSCTQSTGSITATGSGGAAPLQYSIDGISFQSSGIFTGLAPGNYTVTVKDTNACTATVMVLVDPANTVVVNAGSNASICEGAKTTLAGSSNGNTVLWSPVTGLSNPNILNPDASPVISTVYTLTARIGICTATSSVTVFVKPAPLANAGRDTGICFGKTLRLNGSGGISYTWSPVTYLSATNISNPLVVNPSPGAIIYHLAVVDANGCSSLKDDEVTVMVSPPAKLFVGNDDSIAINQPLQLYGIDVNGTGFNNYTWSPAYGLNNPFIANPVAILDRDIVYTVIAKNAYGCSATDDIKIKVFRGPEIYVPNAFTPNDDGKHDIIRAIVIGMREFHYFSIFNRYGEQVFSTTNASKGWDGFYKGSKQPMGAYTWMAEAIDYVGDRIQRRGTVILIR